jgi:asparagine synthase (glutamine-hydrolysing)
MHPASIIDDPLDAFRDAPFVYVRVRNGQADAEGRLNFSAGRRVPRSGGGLDNGAYAQWSWQAGTLEVEHDPFGLMPLYEWRTPHSIALSPSVLKLVTLGAPVDLDCDAMAVFLRMGFMLANDTPFVAIRAVPPGNTRWSPGAAPNDTAYAHPLPERLSRDAALDAFIDLFRLSVGRRLPDDGGVVVPLSGGRDSRHILFELVRHGVHPRFCATIRRYPPAPPEDPRVAALAARAAGVPHLLLDQPGSRFAAEHRKNLATDFCADEHAWFVAMIDRLEREATTTYDGLGGSLSVASRFLSAEHLALFRRGRSTELAVRILEQSGLYSEEVLQALIGRTRRGGLSREAAVARLARELGRHAEAPDPPRAFHFWSRLRRELALVPCGLMSRVPTVHLPLMDYDLVSLLASLPPEIVAPSLSRSDKSFHTDAIRRAYPQWADVPFEDKTTPRTSTSGHGARFSRETARYLLPRLGRRGTLLDRRYLAPRLMYSLANARFAASHAWLASLALYLFQLERVAFPSVSRRPQTPPDFTPS